MQRLGGRLPEGTLLCFAKADRRGAPCFRSGAQLVRCEISGPSARGRAPKGAPPLTRMKTPLLILIKLDQCEEQ